MPETASTSMAVDVDRSSVGSVSQRPAELLIVDDDDTTNDLLAKRLRERGCNVRQAHDGAEALYQIGQLIPDILLLDLCLPDLPGVRVLEELRKRPEWIGKGKVIVISASTDPGQAAVVNGPCVVSILQKPFDSATLIAEVQSVLEQQRLSTAGNPS